MKNVNNIEKMDRRKKYALDKKKLSIDVNKELFEGFEEKTKKDNKTKREVIETLIYRYIHGDIIINKD